MKIFQLKINGMYAPSVRLLSTLTPLFFKGSHVDFISQFLGSLIMVLKYYVHYPLVSVFKLGSRKPQCKENVCEANAQLQIGVPNTFLILVSPAHFLL